MRLHVVGTVDLVLIWECRPGSAVPVWCNRVGSRGVIGRTIAKCQTGEVPYPVLIFDIGYWILGVEVGYLLDREGNSVNR